MVLLEASAFGLPSVVSDIKPLHAIVRDKENGLFFKTGKPEDLANKINILLMDEVLRDRLGQNALKNLKEFQWNDLIRKVESIFTKFAK